MHCGTVLPGCHKRRGCPYAQCRRFGQASLLAIALGRYFSGAPERPRFAQGQQARQNGVNTLNGPPVDLTSLPTVQTKTAVEAFGCNTIFFSLLLWRYRGRQYWLHIVGSNRQILRRFLRPMPTNISRFALAINQPVPRLLRALFSFARELSRHQRLIEPAWRPHVSSSINRNNSTVAVWLGALQRRIVVQVNPDGTTQRCCDTSYSHIHIFIRELGRFGCFAKEKGGVAPRAGLNQRPIG